MRASDFGPGAPGELVRNVDGNLSFIPSSLPGRLRWADGLVRAVTSAEGTLGRLSGLGSKLPNPHRMVRMFMRREAEFSSRIERTYARVQTMVLSEHLAEVAESTPDVREVENNFRILQFACETGERTPVTVALVRRMHEMLFDGLDADQVRAGEFGPSPTSSGTLPGSRKRGTSRRPHRRCLSACGT